MEFFDDVALKALALAQRDADRGVLDKERLAQIRETVDALIANLAEHDEVPAGLQQEGDAPALLEEEEIPAHWRHRPVWCVAGRSALDEAAAALLAHVIEKRGLDARVVSASEVSPANLARLDCTGVQVICISYLDPGNYKNARYLVRRLKKRMPHVHPIACFWQLVENDSHYLDSVEAMEMDDVVSSLNQAADRILVLARRANVQPTPNTPVAAA
jgi:hypothetical protein